MVLVVGTAGHRRVYFVLRGAVHKRLHTVVALTVRFLVSLPVASNFVDRLESLAQCARLLVNQDI